jgi:hypothetical protein
MNYLSVVAFGTARKIDDPEKKATALRVISEHLLEGRWADVREPSEKELKATAVLEFTVDEASAKIRTGPPLDDEEDYDLPIWAGIVPMQLIRGTPVSDSRVKPGVEVPRYVRGSGI